MHSIKMQISETDQMNRLFFSIGCRYCKFISLNLDISIASLRQVEFHYKNTELVVKEQLDFTQRWNKYTMPDLCIRLS